jgi:GntR family transcriptional regulator
VLDETRPIFQQVADKICDDILSGASPEESQVASTNELALFLRINPATAGKGLNLLVDRGILHKKRGIGMFVSPGAREIVSQERTADFTHTQLKSFVEHARMLGLSLDTVTDLIAKEYNNG